MARLRVWIIAQPILSQLVTVINTCLLIMYRSVTAALNTKLSQQLIRISPQKLQTYKLFLLTVIWTWNLICFQFSQSINLSKFFLYYTYINYFSLLRRIKSTGFSATPRTFIFYLFIYLFIYLFAVFPTEGYIFLGVFGWYMVWNLEIAKLYVLSTLNLLIALMSDGIIMTYLQINWTIFYFSII